MKFNLHYRKITIEMICLLYILLFVYAAVSKVLDFENFQVQLGQSPLLSAFAHWIFWMVPTIELIISILLAIPKFRSLGLYAAFSLMVMFTAYIFIVLNYSSFVPCSCGGILEKMSWNVHLVFNIVFVVLAALAILLQNESVISRKLSKKTIKSIKIMTVFLFCSIGIITILFLYSEEIMEHENPFIRRYPQHPVTLKNSVDLKLNSYYFAGDANGKIYLGNYTDPLHLIAFDTTLKHRERIQILLNDKNKKYSMIKTFIKAPYFYLTDGSVPFILRGNVSNWKITTDFKGCPYFSIAQPLDSSTIAIRSNRGKNAEHVLGIFNSVSPPKIVFNDQLLQKQIDGVFDTDGILLSNVKQQKMVYLYYYRNEFIIADNKANLLRRAHTIDTISHAQIKVAFLKGRGEKKMATPPVMVNESAIICENLLFVQSKIKGRYEPKDLWHQADIIDIYNLDKSTYVMSFAIYKNENIKLKYFYITRTHLYVLIDNDLRVYDLKKTIKKEMKEIDL
jgi:hypothetical protein